MSGPAPDEAGAEARARRRARIFGDVLPETTRDDRPTGDAEAEQPGGADAQEEWLRANVPPHHGA